LFYNLFIEPFVYLYSYSYRAVAVLNGCSANEFVVAIFKNKKH